MLVNINYIQCLGFNIDFYRVNPAFHPDLMYKYLVCNCFVLLVQPLKIIPVALG